MLKHLSRRQIVLLSGSPRRRELLRQMGVSFQVKIPKIQETQFAKGYSQKELKENVLRKIKAFPVRQVKDQILIAADTIVCLGRRVLGKPGSKAQAKQFLKQLSGKTHQVITGFMVVDLKTDQRVFRVVKTSVQFFVLSQAQIDGYLKTARVLDKAGAYGIQDQAALFVKGIKGSYPNVVGLPVEQLFQVLTQMG